MSKESMHKWNIGLIIIQSNNIGFGELTIYWFCLLHHVATLMRAIFRKNFIWFTNMSRSKVRPIFYCRSFFLERFLRDYEEIPLESLIERYYFQTARVFRESTLVKTIMIIQCYRLMIIVRKQLQSIL